MRGVSQFHIFFIMFVNIMNFIVSVCYKHFVIFNFMETTYFDNKYSPDNFSVKPKFIARDWIKQSFSVSSILVLHWVFTSNICFNNKFLVEVKCHGEKIILNFVSFISISCSHLFSEIYKTSKINSIVEYKLHVSFVVSRLSVEDVGRSSMGIVV